MLVSDILKSKGSNVVTVDPGISVHELARVLAQHRIGCVVVSSDGTTVAGIVSERDVVRALESEGPSALEKPVGEVCTLEVFTVQPADNIEKVATLMTDRRIRHLPVVVDGSLTGLVSIGDVVKARLAELEDERAALTNYIQG
ncbi:MAG: CBS domain-containing protein [Actinobacteria bacterium]|jgi:CBS domain-containing protein|nr:CBS domain-containing protein [Actinomycetota bacterium]